MTMPAPYAGSQGCVITPDNLTGTCLKTAKPSFRLRGMIPEQRTKEVSRLLADDYSQKILVNTYSSPMSAQKLSRVCGIPIAACYRRIHELEQAGLISVDREKEVYKGRKVRLYKCLLRTATIKFLNGRFVVRYDCQPENNGGNGSELPQEVPQPTPTNPAQ